MKNIEVSWWMYSGKHDDYDIHYETVKAISNTHAIKIIKNKYPRAKSFKTKVIK